jgi:protein involved in polysaccharide export with SLBB domain
MDCWFHKTDHAKPCQFEELIQLATKALKKYLAETTPEPTTITLNPLGATMTINNPNFQLNAGDVVVVTITDTGDNTGTVYTPDAGSVTAVLAGPASDTLQPVVDPSGDFFTITAGQLLGAGNTVTVNALVSGVASGPVGGAVFTFDVVADVVASEPTTITLSAGSESAPGVAASSVAPGRVSVDQATAEASPGQYVYNEQTKLYNKIV